jgi:alpha-tubulin suppressor-like RCC1 family protein
MPVRPLSRSQRAALAAAVSFAVFCACLALFAHGRVHAVGSEAALPQAPATAAVTDTVRVFLPLMAVPPLRRAAVVAGYGHACALVADGGVRCWGAGFGLAPEPMPGLADVRQLSAAGYLWSDRHGLSRTVVRTCAVTGVGALLCWGDLASVQGEGYHTVLTSGAVAAATGGIHACVLMEGGGVQCWGDNYYGELGDGTTNPHDTPAPVIGLSGPAVTVTTGIVQCFGCIPFMTGTFGHSCALLADGRVQCWGDNREGQLGNGKSGDGQYSLTPVAVDLKGKAIDLNTQGVQTCALLADNQVKCWGGDVFRAKPRSVSGLSSQLVALAGGCGVDTRGDIWCWQDGTAEARAMNFEATSYGRGLAECLAGKYSIWCTGYNGEGMLGNGQGGLERADPVPVFWSHSPLTGIAAGTGFACRVTEGLWSLECWGENGQGQLGDESLVDKTVPSPLTSLPGVYEVDLGVAHGCGRGLTNVYCWGANGRQQVTANGVTISTTPLPVPGLGSEVVDLAVGGRHNCVLIWGGAVQCWGDNELGQAGGVTTVQSTPLTVTRMGGPAQMLVAGDGHTCVLLLNGVVQCWGGNQYGELGLGMTSISVTLPTTVTGLPADISVIAAGAHHTCALSASGKAWCWGAVGGRYVEAWEPVKVQSAPHEVAGLTDAGWLFGGGTLYKYYPPFNGGPPPLTTVVDSRTCASAAGGLVCWQVGQTAAPEPVNGFEYGAVQVGIGAEFACAVELRTQHAYCWGRNDKGQLGNASPWSPFWLAVNGY